MSKNKTKKRIRKSSRNPVERKVFGTEWSDGVNTLGIVLKRWLFWKAHSDIL